MFTTKKRKYQMKWYLKGYRAGLKKGKVKSRQFLAMMKLLAK